MAKKIGLAVVALLASALVVAFYALKQPDIPRAVLEAKYASAPSQFMVLSDGTRVHYRDVGPRDGEVILLLHGSNASLFDWEPWSTILSSPVKDTEPAPAADDPQPAKKDPAKLRADWLRKSFSQFRVISVDLPGHGLTGAVTNGDYSQAGMTAFVAVFADKLALSRFVLVGHSMGGGVAARFAELYPDRVSDLVLVDPHTDGMPEGRIPLAFTLARIPLLNKLMLVITPRSMVEEGLDEATVRKGVLTQDFVDRYWDFNRMAGTREATVRRFSLPPDPYTKDHLNTILAPTLILWGEEDRLIPVGAGRAWAKAIPGAKLIVYPATGHMTMDEVADASATDVRNFVLQHIHFEARINPPQPHMHYEVRINPQP